MQSKSHPAPALPTRGATFIAGAAAGLILLTALAAAPEHLSPQPTASAPTRSPSVAEEWPRRIASPAIENLYQLGPGLFSGGEPRGEAAFAQLAALGVKTILSVDGAAPEVETARRHGLRYAHLPLGYQGYADAACARLARAMQTLPGPVFVHCHHGKHRGPAAAAIMAMTALGWTSDRAEHWLRTAGTSTNYLGLYETVRRWRPPAPAALAQVPAEFPEVARTSDLTRAMVEVDRAWDHLKAIAAAGYRTPPEQPDLVPAREAARLAARLTESREFPEVATAGAELLRHFDESPGAGPGTEPAAESGPVAGRGAGAAVQAGRPILHRLSSGFPGPAGAVNLRREKRWVAPRFRGRAGRALAGHHGGLPVGL
jgi:protein tyrosine phosphatase (PTP) superfamily phosphohydrolase (DUF442 family)